MRLSKAHFLPPINANGPEQAANSSSLMDASSGGARSPFGAHRKPGQTRLARRPMYNSQLVASRANLASSYIRRPQRSLNFLYSWYLVSTTCLLRDAMLRRQVHLPPFRNIASSRDLFYYVDTLAKCLHKTG